MWRGREMGGVPRVLEGSSLFVLREGVLGGKRNRRGGARPGERCESRRVLLSLKECVGVTGQVQGVVGAERRREMRVMRRKEREGSHASGREQRKILS